MKRIKMFFLNFKMLKVKRGWLPLVGILCLFILAAGLLLNTYCMYTPDSANYLTLALSLSKGMGYRNIASPGAPFHIKYPPLYPIILIPAALFFSNNLIIVSKIVTILLGFFSLIFLSRLLKNLVTPKENICIVTITALNPLFLQISSEAMAEIPYLFFSLIALLFLFKAAGRRESDSALAIIAGVFTGLSVLTRYIGIALLPTGLIYLGRRKNWKKGSLFLIAALLIIIPWVIRDFYHIHTKGVGSWEYGSYIFYTGSPGIPFGLELFQRAIKGAGSYGQLVSYLLYPFFFPYENQLYLSLKSSFVNYFGMGQPFKVVIIWLTAILLLIGIFSGFRSEKRRLISLYSICYLGLLIFYPARHSRLLVPVLPFLWVFFFSGTKVFSDKIAEKWSNPIRRARAGAYIFYLFFCLLLTVFLVLTNPSFSKTPARESPRPGRFHSDLAAPAAWLREHTSPESIILCERPELFLLSERKVVGAGQYAAVLGGFEEALIKNRVNYIVSGTHSGISYFHRLIANARGFDFKVAAAFPGVLVYQVTPRENLRGISKEDYTGVIKRSEEQLKEKSQDPQAYQELGYFYFKNGNLTKAIEMFHKALVINPDCCITWFNLGSAALDLGDYEEAIRAFKRALEAQSADLIVALARPSLRIARLKRQVEQRPNEVENFRRYLETASLYYSMQEYSLALKDLKEAVRLQPALARPYVLMGLCYENTGFPEDALKSYQKALSIEPEEPVAKARIKLLSTTFGQK